MLLLRENGEDFQSGFRPYHSTEIVLIRELQINCSNHGCISLLLLLDLGTEFETIDNNNLLNRIENYFGIRISALACFKSYLSDHH